MLSTFDLKLLAVLVVTGGSLFFGVLPALLRIGSRFKDSVLLSALLCFGGGVLLSTSIVHILPSIRNDLLGWAEIVYCSGFLLIYLIDVILHVIQNLKKQHEGLMEIVQNTYGTIGNEDEITTHSLGDPLELKCANVNLILAFSIHSLLEGLIIGVEPTVRGVLLLLLAISCHKLLVAFCLGSELSADGRPTYKVIPPLSVFSFGSATGIFIGSVIQPTSISQLHLTIPVLQGLAGGTLLYVVMCEILPRERKRKLHHFGAVIQFISVVAGFTFMTAVTLISD